MSAILRSSSTTRIVGRRSLLHARPLLIVPMPPPWTAPAPAPSEKKKEEKDEKQRAEPESPRTIPAVRVGIYIGDGRRPCRRRLQCHNGRAMRHAEVVGEEPCRQCDQRGHREEPPAGTIGML